MSVVGSRWVGGAPVGGSVGGGRWPVGGRWFCNTPCRKHELFFLKELSLVLIGTKQIQSILNAKKYQGDAKLYN